MIAGSLRKISLGVLLAASAAMLAPSAASAAGPQVYCVVAYGHENPGNCDPYPNLSQPPYAGRVYPRSQPFGYGERGLVYVEGFATPSTTVTVTVSDGTSSVSRVVEAAASSGAPAPFKADLFVHTLGVHEAAAGNPNGISQLTVTAVANDGVADSAPRTTTIDKYAIAPGDEVKDTFKPLLSKLTFPPANWCHLPVSSIGRQRLVTVAGQNSAGGFVCTANEDRTGEVNGAPVLTCSGQPCVVVINQKGTTGQAVVSGLAEDDHEAAFGHAGAIAKVLMRVTQGTTLIRNYGNIVNRVKSTQAKWDVTLKIDDYEPNVVSGDDPYTITVEVFDARGHKQTVSSTFNVYPF